MGGGTYANIRTMSGRGRGRPEWEEGLTPIYESCQVRGRMWISTDSYWWEVVYAFCFLLSVGTMDQDFGREWELEDF